MSERYSDTLADENERLKAEVLALKRESEIFQATAENVWFWEREGNNSESLTCPVVMSAETFRKYERALEEMGKVGLIRKELQIAEARIAKLQNQVSAVQYECEATIRMFAEPKDDLDRGFLSEALDVLQKLKSAGK